MPAERFWPHDLLFRLLPLLAADQLLLAFIYVPLALRGFDDFRPLFTGRYIIRTGHAAELYDYDTQERFEELNGRMTTGVNFLVASGYNGQTTENFCQQTVPPTACDASDIQEVVGVRVRVSIRD